MAIIEELLEPIPLPKMVKVRQHFDTKEIADTAAEVQRVLKESGMLEKIQPGCKTAIAVGSRGVADLPILTRETVKAVKDAGGEPFIVPAMGSHGGATDEGQKEVLEELGVSEETVEAPIRSSMEVVPVGKLPNGLPIYTDKNAYEADHIIVINRIKPHTAFRGRVESGLMKMVTIGLGKQKGAEAAHLYGFKHMAEHVPDMAKIVCDRAPVLFGLGSLENAYDRPAKIVVVPAGEFEEKEPGLLEKAKSFMPGIMADPLDVLIVDEIGKDMSGDGMDPNITGRFATPYASGGANAAKVVVLRLTEKTHGNANGLGLADVTTRRAFEQIEWHKGYANALTSTVLETVKVPMFLDTEELAVKAAVKTCNAKDMKKVRMVRIPNTLEVKDIYVSEGLLDEVRSNPKLEILSDPEPLSLDR
ncbi:lactate racemase domain-containing protein [Alteribacillus sp. JSM 102045]|uniref:lactate racemase domain-containing protein n=1 Tax=Alteribacillus sp. JSM 102045 TaxID=1562101 RepID=UPI0035C1AA4F